MFMKRIALIIPLILCVNLFCHAGNFLFADGHSDYSIVLSNDASVSEKTAAKELQQYIKEISGAILPVKNVKSGKSIFVGWNKSSGVAKPKASSETFTYKTLGNDLYIYGGSQRGSMYGVYSFLENELGVRWYTPDYTKIPHLSRFELKSLNHTESPSLQGRLVLYYQASTNPSWCAHNKQNEAFYIVKNNYGNLTAIHGSHTFFDLVPPSKYFASHPEYFSLYNGKRISDGQLCLSNSSMRKVLINSLLQQIKAEPDYWAYDVSHMDWGKFCQCSKCTAIAKKYGGQSGLMIWFVNQVADAVKKVYPDKKISTFAYSLTRMAPKGIRARDNVVIRLSTIECCFSHPYDSDCPVNQAFMEELRKWKTIAPNIYVWDYVVGFNEYLAPFPNFNTLASNIKMMRSNNAIGVLEEGAHEAPWGEFSEMRQWILAKLLWNPNLDTEKLAAEFIENYYGKAAKDILYYYNMSQRLVKKDIHMKFKTFPTSEIYTDSFVDSGTRILEHALSLVGNDAVMQKRVKRVLAQVYFLHVARNYEQSRSDGTYKKLSDILRDDKTNVRENYSKLDDLLKLYGVIK